MNKKGIALIMAVGVLALLTIIATGFAMNMRLEYYAAVSYSNGIKARYFAEAALARAIAELRTHVKSSAFDDLGEAWAAAGYRNDGAAGSPNITARIESNGTSVTTSIYDEQSKVNINTASTLLLTNLVSRVFPSMLASDVNALVTKITRRRDYSNLNELVSPGGLRTDDLGALRPFITVNSYRDPNCGSGLGRAPININTCDQVVLGSIFSGVQGSSGDAVVSTTQANALAGVVFDWIHGYDEVSGVPVTSWSDFDDTIDNFLNLSGLTSTQLTAIKDNCNPNGDKSKLNSTTTEFCFNSGGYYTVTATGTIRDALDAHDVASRTLSAIVKIYDVYCETTKAQFKTGSNEDKNGNGIMDEGEDVNGDKVFNIPGRVTWLDSCPVESGDLFGKKYSNPLPLTAMTIPGSLKLGYWDNFDEDTAYSKTQWQNYASGYSPPDTSNLTFANRDVADGDNEMTDVGKFRWPLYTLHKSDTTWNIQNFALRVFLYDVPPQGTQMREVGQVLFRDINAGAPPAADSYDNCSCLHAKNGSLTWSKDKLGEDAYAYGLPPTKGEVEFLGDSAAKSKGREVPGDRYQYPGQIRMWPGPGRGDSACYDKDEQRSKLTYDPKKVLNILANGTVIILNCYTSSNNAASFKRTAVPSQDGKISLYGQGLVPAWDDIRIIPKTGDFTSQIINYTLSPSMTGNVEWGTITGTVTIPSTASASSETVTFQTKSNVDVGYASSWKTPGAGDAISSTTGNSIQYKATLATNDPEINETPVLEDVTITYLPKVSIKAYSLSQKILEQD